MTNFEKIKNMNQEEFEDFMIKLIEDSCFLDDDVCFKYCEFRCKNSNVCLLQGCGYLSRKATVNKWLSSDV